MSLTSTTPSLPPQAKARNTGLLYAVWLLMATFTLALWTETQWRAWQDQYSYDRYMEQRAEKVSAAHANYWKDTTTQVVWCVPSIFRFPENSTETTSTRF